MSCEFEITVTDELRLLDWLRQHSIACTVAPLDFRLEMIYWLQNKYLTTDSDILNMVLIFV